MSFVKLRQVIHYHFCLCRNETDAVWLIQNLTTKSDNRVRPGIYGTYSVQADLGNVYDVELFCSFQVIGG
jgi:hypothetical protein